MNKINADNSSTICLQTSLLLLSIICVTHLSVTITYLFNCALSVLLFPLSVISAIGLTFLFTDLLGIEKKTLITSTIVSLIALIGSLLVASFYFDLSWDGQWYHQAAVYNLAETWNPIYKPMATPDGLNHTSILHFPKNSWYFAAAVTRVFDTVEAGKAYTFIALFAAFGAVYSFCRDLRLPVWRSLIFTALVLLNPVVWSEITSYLNDGAIYLFLVIYLASIVSWLQNRKSVHALMATMAICCLVNIKFTGLVFTLIASSFVLIYILLQKRSLIKSFLLINLKAGLLAIVVFGFNPYITNLINRGNLLYPLMGSKQFPGVLDKEVDDNEAYETPKNMQGKSLPTRLIYANFGYPGNAPYNGEDNARLSNPFTTPAKSWSAYHFQETRVSGFGPYFGVLLLLSAIGLLGSSIIWKNSRLPVLIFFVGLCCCISISKHFWWPRLIPMLWLFPLLPVLLFWKFQAKRDITNGSRRRRLVNGIFSLLAVFIGVNGLIVAVIHMRWETASSIRLRSELKQIRDARRPIEIDYGWFKRATEEKLDHWNIKYTPSTLATDTSARKLTSVVEGYPNQILYKIK